MSTPTFSLTWHSDPTALGWCPEVSDPQGLGCLTPRAPSGLHGAAEPGAWASSQRPTGWGAPSQRPLQSPAAELHPSRTSHAGAEPAAATRWQSAPQHDRRGLHPAAGTAGRRDGAVGPVSPGYCAPRAVSASPRPSTSSQGSPGELLDFFLPNFKQVTLIF